MLDALGYHCHLETLQLLMNYGSTFDIACAFYTISVPHIKDFNFMRQHISLNVDTLLHEAVKENFLQGVEVLDTRTV
jgi:hypothetical protein